MSEKECALQRTAQVARVPQENLEAVRELCEGLDVKDDRTGFYLCKIEGAFFVFFGGRHLFDTGASANILHVGDTSDGTGAIRMTGGTINVAGQMRVGSAGSASGILSLSDGTVNIGTDLVLTPRLVVRESTAPLC